MCFSKICPWIFSDSPPEDASDDADLLGEREEGSGLGIRTLKVFEQFHYANLFFSLY